MRRFLFVGLLGMSSLFAVSRAAAQTPCAQDAAFQQLDFWVGTWTVRDAQSEEVVGTNRIERVLRDCALLEHWTSARGDRGLSLFYYHAATQTWQTGFDAYYVPAQK